MSATIKLQVSTADVLPVTNSMSTSMPPVEIPLVATHVNATLVSLVMDSNMLILMNVMITLVMLPQLVPTALIHLAAHVITDGLVMDRPSLC